MDGHVYVNTKLHQAFHHHIKVGEERESTRKKVRSEKCHNIITYKYHIKVDKYQNQINKKERKKEKQKGKRK